MKELLRDLNWVKIVSIFSVALAIVVTLFVLTPVLAIVTLLGVAVVTAIWAQTY